MKITINATVQFYVIFEMTVQGKVNGSNENLTSNWYNMFTVIKLNTTYFKYLSNVERIVYVPSFTIINVTKPYNVTFQSITQYYVFFNSSLPLLNSLGEQLVSGWYNYSEKIEIPFQYHLINQRERNILSNPETIVVNKSLTYIAKWVIQYYVVVKSNYPVYALVDGNNVTFTSGWYTQFDEIQILNITRYVNNSMRYAIYVALPSLQFNSTSPINVSVIYMPQYLVEVNNLSFWVFNDSKIDLYEVIPFYYSGKWAGTYNVPNNSTVTITSAVHETLKENLDMANIISATLLLISSSLLVIETTKTIRKY